MVKTKVAFGEIVLTAKGIQTRSRSPVKHVNNRTCIARSVEYLLPLASHLHRIVQVRVSDERCASTNVLETPRMKILGHKLCILELQTLAIMLVVGVCAFLLDHEMNGWRSDWNIVNHPHRSQQPDQVRTTSSTSQYALALLCAHQVAFVRYAVMPLDPLSRVCFAENKN